MIAYANTIIDIALYGGSLSIADLQQCYKNVNLTEGKFFKFLRLIYLHVYWKI